MKGNEIMAKWLVAAKRADFDGWAEKFHISPVLARIVRNRGLTEEEDIRKFLYGTLEDCHSPWFLKDMELAVEELFAAISRGTAIRVIGDYDVDGICSSYILTKGLGILGAHVDTAIPHRIHDGYGLNENLIREAQQAGTGLIITCDNGISAGPQIQLAKELGMDVIVTDHHEVPYVMEGDQKKEILPEAAAVIDPKRAEDTYPFKGICGAVVAYRVIQALHDKIEGGEAEEFFQEKRQALEEGMEEFLEFAAFATICDVMELKDENRIIVREGLRRMKHSRNRGLRALIQANGIQPDKLSAYHPGFVLGPCLNATGRLDTALRALQLLQSEDDTTAASLAQELKDLNESRKEMTNQGVKRALEVIREQHMENDKVLVIYLPEVHESIAGIIAGKVREEVHHPVFLITRGEEGVKGSGRSIEAYHMYEAMTEVKELFTKFGGHKLAAGFSLREEDVPALRQALNEKCTLRPEDFEEVVHIDVPMPVTYDATGLLSQMELLEPFGVGNPRPLFAQKNLIFCSARRMGKEGQFARFQVMTEDGGKQQLVYFGNVERFSEFLDGKYGPGASEKLFAGKGNCKVSVVYQLGSSTWQGVEELQYSMQYYC